MNNINTDTAYYKAAFEGQKLPTRLDISYILYTFYPRVGSATFSSFKKSFVENENSISAKVIVSALFQEGVNAVCSFCEVIKNIRDVEYRQLNFYRCFRHFEEGFGHFLLLFKQNAWGYYCIQEAQFQNACYGCYEEYYLKVKRSLGTTNRELLERLSRLNDGFHVDREILKEVMAERFAMRPPLNITGLRIGDLKELFPDNEHGVALFKIVPTPQLQQILPKLHPFHFYLIGPEHFKRDIPLDITLLNDEKLNALFCNTSHDEKRQDKMLKSIPSDQINRHKERGWKLKIL